MARFSFRCVLLLAGLTLVVSTRGLAQNFAGPPPNNGGQPNGGPPVYQWHPTDGHPFDGNRRDARWDRRDFRRDNRFASPQISAGWFQRPYPYHLDFYRMRYGGSYAPYFGNLYGTPQVVNYPPYYGPYYGGYGGAYSNGYGPQGYNGIPVEYPGNSEATMPGAEVERSSPAATQAGTPGKATDEALPVPAK